MASDLPLKRISATVRFFRGVSAVRRQLAAADGLVGYALRAKPLARDYRTVSAWTDDRALREFMRTPPHVQLMASLKPTWGRRSSSRGASPRPTAVREWPVPSGAAAIRDSPWLSPSIPPWKTFRRRQAAVQPTAVGWGS
jgi:hypothetical protein